MSDESESNQLYYKRPDEEVNLPEGAAGFPSAHDSHAEAGSDPEEYVLPETNDEYVLPEAESDAAAEADAEEEDDNTEEDDDSSDEADPDYVPEDDGPKPHALLLMLRSLLTPVHGWKAIKRSGLSPDRFASECFYPLTALASVSEFGQIIYGADVPVTSLIVSALIVFISYFVGYFMILVVGRIVLRDGRKVLESNFGKLFVMNALSSLALFNSLVQLLPMLEPVLVFLPLWTIYVVCRGVRFLRLPRESETLVSCVLSLLIVGMPTLVGWLFSLIIPLDL